MQYIEYLFVKTLYLIFSRMPFGISIYIADFITFFIRDVIKYRKEVITQNIKTAFPEFDDSAIKKTRDEVYLNFARLWVELLQSKRLTREYVRKNFTVHNWQAVEEAYAENKGILMVSGHMGNIEWLGVQIAMRIEGLHVIMQRVKNPYLNDLLRKIRMRTGLKLLYTGGAMKNSLKILKQKKIVGIVGDQDARDKGIFVNFFGKASSTATGCALLHLQTGCPVVFATTIRGEWGKFDFYFERVPTPPNLDKSPENIKMITEMHTKLLEGWVRKYPGQYFWTHRRWKTGVPQKNSSDAGQNSITTKDQS